MRLYNLTLQRNTCVRQACAGTFRPGGGQEILVGKGKLLELLSVSNTGEVEVVCTQEIFAIIRQMVVFRMPGTHSDLVALSSDAGKLVIFIWSDQQRKFVLHNFETFGRSGVRRVVPGAYLCGDPRGRALMISAIEQQKFVYVLNRDANDAVTLSSPLEAHEKGAVVFSAIGLDVGYDNPLFAVLEASFYENGEPSHQAEVQKKIVLYEMNLGVNHVIRRSNEPVNSTAHLLIPVPGGVDGPGGFLVCCEDSVIYKREKCSDIVSALPRRLEMSPDQGMTIVSYALHQLKDFFFFLIQTDYGDIYKVVMNINSVTTFVQEVLVSYFDSIPLCPQLVILKNGFLYAPCEASDHELYQFKSIGSENEGAATCSSLHPLGGHSMVAFKPTLLKNLAPIRSLSSLCPMIDMKVLDGTGEGQSQIYCLTGKGPRSALKVLRHGIKVSELASTELPGRPSGVWTLKATFDSTLDAFILLSFVDQTLVLRVMEGDDVEEVEDSPLATEVETLFAGLLGNDSTIQVSKKGYRHILADQTVVNWECDRGTSVVCASAEATQVVLFLSNLELMYWEIDESGKLRMLSKREMQFKILCVTMETPVKNASRSCFLACGCDDATVRVLSLEKSRLLVQLSAQALQDAPQSVCLVNELILASPDNLHEEDQYQVVLVCGLTCGVFIRSQVDNVTGALSDQRSRFLGSAPVSFNRVTLKGRPSFLAMTTKTWVSVAQDSLYEVVPLAYERLELATSFVSASSPDSIIGIAGETLKIVEILSTGEHFSETQVRLAYTPRKLIPLPPPLPAGEALTKRGEPIFLAILEAEQNSFNLETRKEIRTALRQIQVHADDPPDMADVNDEERIGTYQAGEMKWGSCVRILDPTNLTTKFVLNLDVDEAATCMTVVYFFQFDRPCLIVGTVTKQNLRNKEFDKAQLRTYMYDDEYVLRLIHTTALDGVPLALFPYEGSLLAGVGKTLRIYSLGRKKLLLKSEYRKVKTGFSWIQAKNNRIFAADIQDSITVLVFSWKEKKFFVLAHDILPRYVTAAVLVDHHTVICGDKFDNLFTVRVPFSASTSDANNTYQCDMDSLKLEQEGHFFVGETITSFQKCVLSPGGSEVVLYSTLQGSLGVLLPITSHDEGETLKSIEVSMRNLATPHSGRDHFHFRSSMAPCENVTDGDYLETFPSLKQSTQVKIVEDTQLNKTRQNILRKLEDMKNRII